MERLSAPETRRVQSRGHGRRQHGEQLHQINRGEGVPELHKKASGLGDAEIIRHANSTFITPGFHDAKALFEDPLGTNNGRTEYRPQILHFITPETQ